MQVRGYIPIHFIQFEHRFPFFGKRTYISGGKSKKYSIENKEDRTQDKDNIKMKQRKGVNSECKVGKFVFIGHW